VASEETYAYTNLIGTDFSTQERRAMYFYMKYRLTNYNIDFPNPEYFKIMMKVDPCRIYGATDLCCDQSNEAVCEDNTSIVSGTDIGIAWFMNGYVMQCSALYTSAGSCGTYIEIHEPNN
jgi:hypothetical protein